MGALDRFSGATPAIYVLINFIGWIVYLRAFSFPSQALTASRNPNPEFLASLLVNGQ
jgi:hypothetical protein